MAHKQDSDVKVETIARQLALHDDMRTHHMGMAKTSFFANSKTYFMSHLHTLSLPARKAGMCMGVFCSCQCGGCTGQIRALERELQCANETVTMMADRLTHEQALHADTKAKLAAVQTYNAQLALDSEQVDYSRLAILHSCG